ncbi:FmdB family zinc ribbon protein [Subtercola boreus]|uniref:FmdB family transcriptional regulator n=1 Tax=Subtercola boreus TaxID=120213 RepID=A0A3E0WB60_9MICO|nr:FmdB family zinc ribbon protein [Subtercola boreus]RFA19287.1 FmdB family transcriptional regulator [Subtercola boreus]RFA19547.1 FmdB family transcriptional regulator [Subtercola boreus]RFA25913.1 FmdB family transcriptional regulator [Subtercola boreus]
MPTYSYRCTQCDKAFDIQQSFTDDNLTVCPVCGGKLRKVFSPIGVSFTGSGFYRNDSRATTSSSEGAKKSEKKAPETSSSGSSSSGSSSSESKPAAAPSTPSAGGSSSTPAT